MGHFSVGLAWRLLVIVLLSGLMVYVYLQETSGLLLVPLLITHIVISVSLYRYVTGLNRKLTRFLESVRYSDFTVAFRTDNDLGPSFRDLNIQFNEVLDAFRVARAEKEANLHYLNTIVQHVSVGLLTFDTAGQVELVNQAALRLLGIYRLRHLNDLRNVHPDLVDLLQSSERGPSVNVAAPIVYQTGSRLSGSDRELSIRCASVRLRGRLVTVASLQNIRTELQQRELEAWQNLTKVLRHEIMNSITPIVSLAGTMRDIVETDLLPLPAEPNLAEPSPAEPNLNGSGSSYRPLDATYADAVGDLRDALMTIEQRGEGIMRFVDAYRHFTSIPQPVFDEVSVEKLLRHVAQLVQADKPGYPITISVATSNLSIRADGGQIEMVLINLLRNAIESLGSKPDPLIQISAVQDGARVVVQVADNGPGIEPEAMEQIFIPFYTTKKTGSGIGLSLSRQIMQLHDGQLTVESTVGQGSTFSLVF
ncbi:PAS domain-containing protein [Fibrisoma montanum]|uniref:histidine kinase n=1 Tax=Fibrisoma montanum TaxID=2305895 RepID=A0A418M539_9BACT|nr:ATP-binding protein [Fibrisoma montanum]RIV20783.1 PAS domain-containing protein [Fibrisoma montanum]